VNEDQRDEWRCALAAKAKASRSQRGKRKRGLAAVTRAGMVRVNPTQPKEISMTTKSLSAAQIKRHIGPSGSMLVLADIDGTMWASNRYWLTRAEPLEPFLRKHSISDTGAYIFENGSVGHASKPDADVLSRFLDLAQYTVPLENVSIDHYDEIYTPGPEGYLQLFRAARTPATRIVAVLADQLNWLEDTAPPPEDGRVSEMRVATTERVNGPVAIIAEPIAPEPEDETAQPVLIAVVMPSIQRPGLETEIEFDDAKALAWYRATYADGETSDDLALARMAAWARGQSLGPDVHGIPRRPGAETAECPF
jgi:hypothetical protein